MGRENIFQTDNGNKSLHQGSNDNGIRIANSATIKTFSCQEHNVPAAKYSEIRISMIHRAFFNTIIDKTPTHALLIQHYISLSCWFH